MYKNLQYIPTKKLKEILDTPHCTGVNGADYEPVRHELEQILWERLNRLVDDLVHQYEDYEDFLDSQGVPPVPTECYLIA